jgi:transposase
MSETPTTQSRDSFTHFAGFDWATEQHDVVVVDRDGRIVEQFHFEHSANGWSDFRQRIAAYPNLAVTIETSCGPSVERLLELGLAVYPVRPLAAARYRERKAPSGVKTNLIDAWSLADALRLDGHTWRRLKPEDPLIQELRLICRDEVTLIEQRTAFINQLRQALHEYFPAALEAFDDWTMPAAWEFVIKFPTSEKLARSAKRDHDKFLRKHGLVRPETYSKRMQIFARADQFQGRPPVTAAKSRLAVALARQLLALEEQLQSYRTRIRQLFEEHPDHELFGSLPGAADKLAPRLLAECGGDPERFQDTQELQCVAGTAPVTFQSGQMRQTRIRRACNKFFRAAVHLWTNLSRAECAWAEAYYQQKRAQKMSHSCALRCLGQRWLKIVRRMLQTHEPYNEALHTLNQTTHGSWVVALMPEASTAGQCG